MAKESSALDKAKKQLYDWPFSAESEKDFYNFLYQGWGDKMHPDTNVVQHPDLETALRHEGNLKSLETDYRPDAYGTSEAPFQFSQEYVTWINEREKNKMLDAGEDLVQDRLKFDDFNQKLDKIEELYPNSPMNVVTEPLRILINDYKERLDSFVGEVVEDKFSPEANVTREYMAGDEDFQAREAAAETKMKAQGNIIPGIPLRKEENENKY